MNNFYEIIKNSVSLEQFKENIHFFNLLNDFEIKTLIDDDTISFEYKEYIANMCSDRINRLSNDLWIACVSYTSNSNLFIKNYIPRVNTLSYEEILVLINNMITPDCILTILNSDNFSHYLEIEKDQNGTFLQCLLLSSKIYLSDENLEQINSIGEEINKFYETQTVFSDDIENVIVQYLTKVIENISKISLDSNVMNQGINLLNNTIKKHFMVNEKMLEFYILYRKKELHLEDVLKSVNFFSDDSDIFGNYQELNGEMQIFPRNLKKVLSPILSKLNIGEEEKINDMYNHLFLEKISHELSHIIDHKKQIEFLNLENGTTNNFFLYKQLNNVCRLNISYEEYVKNHDKFINEVRADIFSILDFSNQVKKLFKGSFSEDYLQRVSALNATRIIDFYTDENENGKCITSPIEKFISFYNEVMPVEMQISQPPYDIQDSDIINNLLLGSKIPIEMIMQINKIAKGKIVTTDLTSEIMKMSEDYNNLNKEEKIHL